MNALSNAGHEFTSLSSIERDDVMSFVKEQLGDRIHQKLASSIANATFGVLHTKNVGVAAVGRTMAAVSQLNPKHTIKQFDRLLSNPGFHLPKLFDWYVPWVLGKRTEAVVTIDWTEFAADGQSTCSINLVTSHGRATPLIWTTVASHALKHRMNEHEDTLLRFLRQAIPGNVSVTVLGDRGFGSARRYQFYAELGLRYILRFRQDIHVEPENEHSRPARAFVRANGAAHRLRNPRVTNQRIFVPFVVCTKQVGMKEAWCLATNRDDKASEIVKLYGRRFTTEENFRDQKDPRFGYGLSAVKISIPIRRDRFMFLIALATVFLTLLGAAGESIGIDRMLRANTETKKRTHSLFRQGREYIAGAASKWSQALREAFHSHFKARTVSTKQFCII